MILFRFLKCAHQRLNRPAIMSRVSAAASVFLLLFLASFVLLGQERFGSFLGTVTDPSGAVLPNATVTLTNKESGREYKTTTDGSGAYIFRAVEPGHYSFVFEQTG